MKDLLERATKLGEMPDLSERALCQPILKEVGCNLYLIMPSSLDYLSSQVVAVLSSVQSREASANWMGEVKTS